MVSISAYSIIVCVLVVIVGVAAAIYYYSSYKQPSVSDWVKDGIIAGCTVTTKEYLRVLSVLAALLKI